MQKYFLQTALLGLLLIGGVASAYAQDFILLRDGNLIECKVEEISQTEIRYRPIDNLDGPVFVISADRVFSIRFENGTVHVIEAVSTNEQKDIQRKFGIGLGGNFSASFGIFNVTGEENSYYGGNLDDSFTQRIIGGGFYIFFDTTYVEANLGFLFGTRVAESFVPEIDSYGDIDGISKMEIAVDISYLTLGLFGKYPVTIGSFTLFPMMGIQWDIGMSLADVTQRSVIADLTNRFWIKLGAGADMSLTDRIYFRPSFFYGINFGSQADRDGKVYYDMGFQNVGGTSFHHGLDIRAALGFRF